MKKIIFLTLVLISFGSPVFGQAGQIRLYSDVDGTNCNLFDISGLLTVYVIHEYTPGATGSQFMVQQQYGAALTFVGESSPYIIIGHSQSGIAISYGGCVAGPNQILTIYYIGSGLSATCSRLEVVDDPTAVPPGIYVADCASPPNLLTGTGYGLTINPDMSCPCSPFSRSYVTVATEPSGLEFTVDSWSYTTPQVFDWVEGTSHSIRVDSPQDLGGVTYEFSHWSDGGAMAHTILVPSMDTGYTAHFISVREVTINTDPQSLEVTVDGSVYTAPETFNWWAGSSHDIGVSYSQMVDDTVYTFSGWSDGGAMSHSITVPEADTAYTASFSAWPAYAAIDSIKDVPNDQGGWVRIYFERSGYDVSEEPVYPIAAYNIWQRLENEELVRAVINEGEKKSAGVLSDLPVIEWQGRQFISISTGLRAVDFPAGMWEVVGSFAAIQRDQYIYRASTRADTSTAGVPYSVYAISAHTTTPSVWFMSPPDSGYSVDNLAPAAPRGLTGRYESAPVFLTLQWNPNTEADLSQYFVYLGEGPDFVPSKETFVMSTRDNIVSGLQIFPEEPWHFKVSALDVHGNESEFAVLPPDFITVPTFVSSYQSVWTGKAIEVRWVVDEASPESVFRIYRREGLDGKYEVFRFEINREGDSFSFQDKSTRPNESYAYKVTLLHNDGELTLFETTIKTPSLVLSLHQNFPNPFFKQTLITFDLPKEMRVKLTVYDIAGRKIKTLLDGLTGPGSFEVPFDAGGIASGIYFCKLEAGDKTFTRKMVVTK